MKKIISAIALLFSTLIYSQTLLESIDLPADY